MAELEEVEVPERSAKRQKVDIPEGMSKNAWKKIQKQKRWEEQKDDYRLKRKEKKKAARVRKAERKANGADLDNNYHLQAKKALPQSQKPSGVKIIMDCEFDDLMSDKEIVSMSNQITRCYSAKRHADYEVDLVVSSFNKRLKARFEKSVLDYSKWQNMKFKENDTLAEILPSDKLQLSKYVYLTADTDNELESLDEDYTYIIGGIVDKNRHKKLCLNKANELGLKVARLPIGKYIEMNGRHVLATSHVYEIMCMWFEMEHSWEKAFNAVLPPRKLKKGTDGENNDEVKESEESDEKNEETVSEESDEKNEETISQESDQKNEETASEGKQSEKSG